MQHFHNNGNNSRNSHENIHKFITFHVRHLSSFEQTVCNTVCLDSSNRFQIRQIDCANPENPEPV